MPQQSATTSTPISDREIEQSWPEYVRQVESRLDMGRRNYGDASFSADPATLLTEIQAELEDVAGWSFVLWCRLQRLKKALRAAQERAA